MTLLEQTIIAIAAQRLTEAKDLADSDREASGKAMRDLFTLVEIAYVKVDLAHAKRIGSQQP